LEAGRSKGRRERGREGRRGREGKGERQRARVSLGFKKGVR